MHDFRTPSTKEGLVNWIYTYYQDGHRCSLTRGHLRNKSIEQLYAIFYSIRERQREGKVYA